MNPDHPDEPTHSRLSKHLALLDLDDPKLPPQDVAEERAFVDGMVPRPLALKRRRVPTERKKRWQLLWIPLSLTAAAFVLTVFRPPAREENPWQIKGAESIQIFVEQQGAVRTLQQAGELLPMARIKVEVLATAPSLAFWGVASKDGRLLTDADWIWQNRLSLDRLEKKFFPGSLQLDGPSEGENLCVVLCPASLAQSLDQKLLIERVAGSMGSKASGTNGLESCSKRCAQLRP